MFITYGVDIREVHAAAPTDYISCWDLDETSGTRVDAETTNSNDLTDNNTVLSAAGKISNAADFERTQSEYLSITNANSTNLNITGSFSIAVWVKTESDPVNDTSYQLVNRLQATDGYRLAIFRTVGGVNQIRRGIYNNPGGTNTDVTTTITAGTWYHFIWTYDASTNSSLLYKDGNTTPISSVTTAVDPGSISSDLRLGSNAEVAGQYMDGLMDVVEIYGRVLSTAEVTSLYNSGSGVACAGRGGGGGTPAIPNNDIIIFE